MFQANTPDETPIPGTEHSGSSDDEVHHLLHASMSTPVQFRTSPPLEALKPAGQMHVSSLTSSDISTIGITTLAGIKGRSLSPPPKLLHCELSPRKRSRHARHSHVQRPCLDFEKMQQVCIYSLYINRSRTILFAIESNCIIIFFPLQNNCD